MSLADAITVLVPTSPIPSHPSPAIITATLDSLVATGLEACRTIVMCDGVRPEQGDRWEDYEAYRERLALTVRSTVEVVQHWEFLHQAELTRRTLAERVTTPLVLFVEHDTPLCGEIPWASMVAALSTDEVDVIRLHHEAAVLADHRYLMKGRRRADICGVPLWATAQWSQRPHLAKADWYRRMLDSYFAPHARTMIEDRLYSRISTPWVERGEWGKVCKLWLYAPYEGTWKRSEHLDGRAGESKYEMVW